METQEDLSSHWDDYADQDDGLLPVDRHDFTIIPNDFRVTDLQTYMETGQIRIPGYQRNYVWDLRRASRFIESLSIPLPVPELFFYEKGDREIYVIDGQQRLMSIYYFLKGRFPRSDGRAKFRQLDDAGRVTDKYLHDDERFQQFTLCLPGAARAWGSLHGESYEWLEDSQRLRIDMRPIRCVFVRQNDSENDSSIYDLFSRLSAGGMNLTPQEIRWSMFQCKFYEMLQEVNRCKSWRRMLRSDEPDLRLKDIEILLRGLAMLIDHEDYAPSMLRFLNRFSRVASTYDDVRTNYLKKLFLSFGEACSDLSDDAFLDRDSGRFNVALYEAVFASACQAAYEEGREVMGRLDEGALLRLKHSEEFNLAAQRQATEGASVRARLSLAKKMVPTL